MALRGFTATVSVQAPSLPERTTRVMEERQEAGIDEMLILGLSMAPIKKERVPLLREWLSARPDVAPEVFELLNSFTENDWDTLKEKLLPLTETIPNELFPIAVVSETQIYQLVGYLLGEEETTPTGSVIYPYAIHVTPALFMELVHQLASYGFQHTWDIITSVQYPNDPHGFVMSSIGTEAYHLEYEEELNIFRQKLKIQGGAYRCPNCGSNSYYFQLLQIRSADEPQTEFFTCSECRTRWRN